MRNTKQRETVLTEVQSRHDHPSADQIYDDIHAKNPHISRATVYRNLNLLSEQGKIRHVQIPGSHSDSYDCNLKPHSHLICTVCGRMTDIDLAENTAQDRKLMRQTGYQAIHHSLVFEGICPACQKKLQKAKAKSRH